MIEMINKKDLIKLRKLLKNIEEIELEYDDLTPETQDFLQNKFTNNGTKIHLYEFDRNITDAIREIMDKNRK